LFQVEEEAPVNKNVNIVECEPIVVVDDEKQKSEVETPLPPSSLTESQGN